MSEQPTTVAPGEPDAPHVVAKGLFDQFVDGISAVSIVTLVAYAIVFGFEEGFNAFFGLPSDFVATGLLSVLHVLTLVVYVMTYDHAVLLLEIVAVGALALIPAWVYGRHPRKLAICALLLYCISTIVTPVVLLTLAVAVCFILRFNPKADDMRRTRLLSRVGDGATKVIFVFVLALTPLYYFGFRYAEIQNPRLVLIDESTWVVARVMSGSYVTVRLLNDKESVPQCVDQFADRPQRLSRSVRVVKDDDKSALATWREFTVPLNYCLFQSEKLKAGIPILNSLVFIRQGLGPPSASAEARARAPVPATPSVHR